MENNKNKKSVKFQGDMLNFCDFIQVFVFTPNHHLNHSQSYPYNIIQSTLDVSNTVISESFLLKEISLDTFSEFVCFADPLVLNRWAQLFKTNDVVS